MFFMKMAVGYYKYIKNIGCGHAFLQMFVGLNGTAKELELPMTNMWCFTDEDLDSSAKNYLELSAEEAANAPVPLFFISFNCTKDPSWNARYPGMKTLRGHST